LLPRELLVSFDEFLKQMIVYKGLSHGK